MHRHHTIYVITLIAHMLLAAPVLGDGQKPSRPLGPPPEPESAPDLNLGELVDLWDSAGAPSIFILCGVERGVENNWARQKVAITTPGGRTRKSGTTISDDESAEEHSGRSRVIERGLDSIPYMHRAMTCNDPSGFASGLANNIAGKLSAAGIDDVSTPEVLGESKSRLMKAYAANDNQEAMESIFTELPGALVIHARVYSQEMRDGDKPLARVNLSLELPGGGLNAGADTFDIEAGTSAMHIRGYTADICEAIKPMLKQHFEKSSGRGYLIKAKFLDVSPMKVQEIKQAMVAADSAFRSLNARGGGLIRGRETIDANIRFRGSAIDLYNAMYRILPETCGLLPQLEDTADGTLTVSLTTVPKMRDPESMTRREILEDRNDPRRAELLKTFKAEYDSEQRPRIAVLVNRSHVEADLEGEYGEWLKKQAPNGNSAAYLNYRYLKGPSKGIAVQALDTETMRVALQSELDHYGMMVVKPELVRSAIVKSASLHGDILNDTKIVESISQMDSVNLLLQCSGRKESAKPPRFRYTFEITSLDNGDVLANAGGSVEATDFRNGQDPLSRLARHAVAKLIDDAWRNWESPRTMRVIVTHARTQSDVLSVMKAFELHFRGDVKKTFFLSHRGVGESGVGEFDMDWEGDFTSLIASIQENKGVLPFSLDVPDTKSSRLTIRIKESMIKGNR